MFGKLNLGSITNRVFTALDSLTSTAGKTDTPNFYTPGFNQTSGQNQALNRVAMKFALGQQDNLQQTAKDLIGKYKPKNFIAVGKFDSKGLGAEFSKISRLWQRNATSENEHGSGGK